MSTRSIGLSEHLQNYLTRVSVRESALQAELRDETARATAYPNMQISPEQGQFMHLVLRLMNARRVIEIGTFTGYSALCMAQALPADGELITCDINAEWTQIAQRYWQKAGLEKKIQLRIGPALDTLHQLLQEGRAGAFDFVFIDADKTGYDAYYECALKLVKTGGLIAVDNVLWNGRVADLEVKDADTAALRAFNEKMKDDKRVVLSMIPLADGLSLALKI